MTAAFKIVKTFDAYLQVLHEGLPRANWNQLYFRGQGKRAEEGLGKMGTQLNLNTDTVGSIVIGIPNTIEQALIANYLDKTTTEFDAMTATIEAAIDRSVEYHQTVITSAVTGRIDVRGLA